MELIVINEKKFKLMLDRNDMEAYRKKGSGKEVLREIINDMAIQNEKTNSLRIQAENDLNTVLEQVKVLEEAIKKLSGPKFGALIGATYTNGEYGLMAGVTVSLK